MNNFQSNTYIYQFIQTENSLSTNHKLQTMSQLHNALKTLKTDDVMIRERFGGVWNVVFTPNDILGIYPERDGIRFQMELVSSASVFSVPNAAYTVEHLEHTATAEEIIQLVHNFRASLEVKARTRAAKRALTRRRMTAH